VPHLILYVGRQKIEQPQRAGRSVSRCLRSGEGCRHGRACPCRTSRRGSAAEFADTVNQRVAFVVGEFALGKGAFISCNGCRWV
jgi:hypothetical protein